MDSGCVISLLWQFTAQPKRLRVSSLFLHGIISLVGVRPQVWWKEQEADQLLGDMSSQDVAEALAEAGIEVGPKAQQQHRKERRGFLALEQRLSPSSSR